MVFAKAEISGRDNHSKRQQFGKQKRWVDMQRWIQNILLLRLGTVVNVESPETKNDDQMIYPNYNL